MKVKAPVFIRDATGLVRSLSAFDLFNLAYGQIMPAVGIVFIVSFSPFAFPQSNMFLAFLIVMPLVALGPALIYSMLAAAMPRSGGDYVYVSRIIHPALGFMTNWLFTCVVYSFIATAGFVFSSTAFNVFVATIGTMTNNPWLVNDSVWFTTNTGELATGTVLIAAVMILLVYKTAVWKFMKILFVIVMVGTIVNIFYLMSVSQSAFVTAFNSQFASSGFTYNGIIQTATKNGYLQGWTWTGTIGTLIYAMGGLVGFNFSVFGGRSEECFEEHADIHHWEHYNRRHFVRPLGLRHLQCIWLRFLLSCELSGKLLHFHHHLTFHRLRERPLHISARSESGV